MAITVSEWKEARDKIDNLVKFIFSNYGYDINRDFVLKVCLVMYSGDIRFRVTNIKNIINEIKNNFDNIYLLIKSICEFTSQSYIDNGILRSKYALIPIIYYAFKCEVYNFESISDKYKKDKIEMIKWLRLSLLVGAFGGQPDALLIGLRKIIDSNYKDGFPINQIIQEYKAKSKDLTITKEIAESRIAEAEKGSFYCKLILSLTEMMNYQFSYHEDHLHPGSFFKSKLNIECLNISDDDKSFMLDEKNWNTIGNIHLLNASENQSKNDTPLEAWFISNPNYKKEDFFIPVNAKGDYIVSICDFRDFILKRREILINKLVELTR